VHPLARLDHQYVWHPFTQMRQWLRREPIIIQSGAGTVLQDIRGREYLDGNSSIWTNLHGHGHPKLNAALQRQLKRIAHSSALGLANEPASRLAARLVAAANVHQRRRHRETDPSLRKVFFSDDGSTALEVALKLAYEYTRRIRGRTSRPRFLSLSGAYHGDTVGAVSAGQIKLFRKAYSGLLFSTDQVPAPYCYRCPYNRARPERGDARTYRSCQWECIRKFEQTLRLQRKKRGEPYAAFIVEPLIQGAAGMIPQPDGWLPQIARLVRSEGTLLIADEVMTGFARTGHAFAPIDGSALARGGELNPKRTPIFATNRAGVSPDFLCLAKGLTGGYLPMAATLTIPTVFDAFLGEYDEFKTFFHGHSYTGNQLGAAVALASLDILQSSSSIHVRARLEQTLRDSLQALWELPNVGDVRQVGLVVGVELVRNWRTREPFDLRQQIGARVCDAMARRGVLTRPIGNVIVLMPPYCTTPAQVRKMVSTMAEAIEETMGGVGELRS
jgi:adenosylmethionine-8-amino-7-oxononanoate aminotransferase